MTVAKIDLAIPTEHGGLSADLAASNEHSDFLTSLSLTSVVLGFFLLQMSSKKETQSQSDKADYL
jgi:hypothetical protein